jgi:hypothetical protein
MPRVRFVLLAFALGCSSVSTPMSAVDADVSSTDCETYCECMTSVCEEDDPLGCVNECQALADDVRSCRIIHCGLAQDAENASDEPNRMLHCGHANGIGLCQSN